MKNGLFRKVMALTLIVVMSIGVATISAGAATFGSGEVTATTEVKNPTVTMGLPTSVKVTIDPYDTLGTGKSLSSNVFSIINKGNVPVQVVASSFGMLGADVSLVATMTSAELAETAAPQKLMVVDLQYASAVGAVPASNATPDVTWGSTTKNLTKDASVDFGFALDKTGGTSPWTAFQLAGAVQPYADWKATDMKFYVTFDYRGLTAADYAAVEANLESTAHRLIKDANLPTTVDNKIISLKAGDSTAVDVDFKNASLDLSGAKFYKLATCVSTSEITTGFAGGTGKVTITPSANATFIKAGATKPTMVYVKAADGTVYSFGFFAYA